MKKIHIFAPQNHSNQFICDVGKMASHSFVTRHCEAVQRHDHSNIEYIYAADGTKLRTIHRPSSSSALTDSIDYIGNLILKNGQPSMYLFDGGYASFNSNGAINGWHYFIQDYMGNNRMVVNKNGTNEQVTHYYPYGGVIGDISTNENVRKYKFEGKELDRTFGLDNYDIHARQYFAMMPSWDRIDPLAEDSPQFSPYGYCMGDPVNFGDYNGMNPIYDKEGNFLGTDDMGLQGNPYIMDASNFKQGMSHSDAGEFAILGNLPDDVMEKINNHFNTLPMRPDYDGFVTIDEGIEWGKSHPNARENPTPDNTLYIDASKLEFGNISTTDFKATGVPTYQNLFNNTNLLSSFFNYVRASTVYALGQVHMILLDYNTREVQIVNDEATIYDWDKGGGRKRDFAIKINNAIARINPQIHGFRTYYYGIGQLNK